MGIMSNFTQEFYNLSQIRRRIMRNKTVSIPICFTLKIPSFRS